MHVDLNNIAYAQGLAFILREHINNLPNNKCSMLAAYLCETCALIRTWHHVGSLEYIITLLERGYYEYEDWWDSTDNTVRIEWLEERWKLAPKILA